MDLRRVAAAACAVAGVAVLAGPGWALLAAAVLLCVVPARLAAAGRGIRARAVSAWRWLASGRRAVATASMPAAVVLAPVGAGVMAGVGAGLLAAAVALGAVSVLSGWNA